MIKKFKKKADLNYDQIALIVMVLVFSMIFLMFIGRYSNNSLIYEQTYSKQIALFIDSAKPNTTIVLEVNDLIDVAKSNNKKFDDIFKVSEFNEVIVSLDDRGGYGYKFYTDRDVQFVLNGGYLTINIK
jgi:hypothetical protein